MRVPQLAVSVANVMKQRSNGFVDVRACLIDRILISRGLRGVQVLERLRSLFEVEVFFGINDDFPSEDR